MDGDGILAVVLQYLVGEMAEVRDPTTSEVNTG